MNDQEYTIAYADTAYEDPMPTDSSMITPEDADSAVPEELTDAEYAEIIGEETAEPAEEQEGQLEDIPSVFCATEPERPVPRRDKKRRRSKGTPASYVENSYDHTQNLGTKQGLARNAEAGRTSSYQHGQAPHGRKEAGAFENHQDLHNIGGVDTLKMAGEHKDSQSLSQEGIQPQKQGDTASSVSAPSVSPRHLKTSQPGGFIKDMERGGRASARAARSYLAGNDTAEQTGEQNLRKYGAVISDAAGILAAAGGKAEAGQQQFNSRQFTESAVNAERAIVAGFIRREDLLLSKKALREKLNGTKAQPWQDEGESHKQVSDESAIRTSKSNDNKEMEHIRGKGSLSKADKWGIIKNRRAIYDSLVVKEELIRLKDTAPDQKHVFARTKVAGRNVIGISRHESRKQVGILTSGRGRFFDDFQYGAWTQNMIAVYFSRHEDPMLRKINPARMRVKELKRILEQSDQYRLKPTDVSMIRTLIRGKSALKHRQADRYAGPGGGLRAVRSISRRGIRYLEQTDDVTAEGYRRVAAVYRGIRTVKPVVHLAGTVGVKTAGAVWHLPPVAYARGAAMKPVRKGTQAAAKAVRTATASAADTVKTITKNRIAGVRAADGLEMAATKEMVRTTGAAGAGVKTASSSVRTAVGKGNVANAGKKGIRVAGNKTGKAAKRTTGKLSRRIKKLRENRVIRSATFIGRRIGEVLHITTAPIRWTLTGFSKIYTGIRRIIAAVLVIFFAAILLFLLLIMFSAFITSVGNATGEVIEKVVTDEDIVAHIRHLNERNLGKFQEAIDIVKAGPQHDPEHIDSTGRYPDEAYGGEKLYHFGSPKNKYAPDADYYHNDLPGDVPGGFHYIYLNAAGQIIGNNTNNTKDIICLTSVMVGNDYDEDAIVLAPGLMDVWFDYLNPAPTYTVSELHHKEGTDVFPHEAYTFEGRQYYCNDSDFYEAYEDARSEGVYFYEFPHAQTERGCRTDWDTFWDDYDAWWDDRPGYPDYPDHRDYETDEEWEAAKETYYEAVDAYYEEKDLWYDAKPESDDYRTCPGHDALACSYGYRDINVYVTILTKEDVYAAAENGNALTYRVPLDYASTTWETRSVSLDIPAAYADITEPFAREGGWSNIKHQEWCDHLYGGDWYYLYGADTYEDSVSLPSGEGRLSQEQIDEMAARIGDVSEARQAIISFAIDHVGRIPYYWGGKPAVPGYEGNGFGTIVEADYKGRNRKGLDCSGFVGWVYWSVVGVKPSKWLTTSDIVPSLGLRRIGYDELMPGDIGMEALPGAGSNHIGYFVGYNEDGRTRWAHESSGAGNVAVNTANCFRYYYRLFED